jgi:hypothetical protein
MSIGIKRNVLVTLFRTIFRARSLTTGHTSMDGLQLLEQHRRGSNSDASLVVLASAITDHASLLVQNSQAIP